MASSRSWPRRSSSPRPRSTPSRWWWTGSSSATRWAPPQRLPRDGAASGRGRGPGRSGGRTVLCLLGASRLRRLRHLLSRVSPRMFSFNNPYGACPECGGIGTRYEIDPALVAPNPARSLKDGALAPWAARAGRRSSRPSGCWRGGTSSISPRRGASLLRRRAISSCTESRGTASRARSRSSSGATRNPLARGEAGARAFHGAPGLPCLSGLPAPAGDAGREDRGALHLRCGPLLDQVGAAVLRHSDPLRSGTPRSRAVCSRRSASAWVSSLTWGSST